MWVVNKDHHNTLFFACYECSLNLENKYYQNLKHLQNLGRFLLTAPCMWHTNWMYIGFHPTVICYFYMKKNVPVLKTLVKLSKFIAHIFFPHFVLLTRTKYRNLCAFMVVSQVKIFEMRGVVAIYFSRLIWIILSSLTV